jgi:hypothetical protein
MKFEGKAKTLLIHFGADDKCHWRSLVTGLGEQHDKKWGQFVDHPVTQESRVVAPSNFSTAHFLLLLGLGALMSQEKTFEPFAGVLNYLLSLFLCSARARDT